MLVLNKDGGGGGREYTSQVYFKPQLLEHPSIGKYWNIFGPGIWCTGIVKFWFIYVDYNRLLKRGRDNG